MVELRSLIVGASGQVGTQMRAALGVQGLPTSRVEQPGWLPLDLAELRDVGQLAALLDGQALDAIYCVGGMTHVDVCESQPEAAYAINARGPGIVAAYAQERGLPFVFYSTEYVFAGAKDAPGPYTEDSPVEPLSVYGKSKLAGEEAVLATHAKALVLRTTVVYGPDPRQKNYIYSLMKNLTTGTAMRVPQDQVSTPTYNRDLIATTLGLVKAGARGVFHVAGPEVMDRLVFAQRVAAALGLDTSLLQGLPTRAMGQPAARPLDAGLAIGKLERMYPALRMRGLDESLADCLGELRLFLG